MSDIIDINVGQTVEEVTINVVDNVIQVNINKITGGGGAVDSVNGQTGIIVLDQDDIADGVTYKQYSLTEKNKLAGIAAGAEVNVNADWNAVSGDAQILNKPTIPDVSTLVPYTGATTNVDLGEFELKAGQLTLDTTPTGTAAVTTTRWNDSVGVSETTLKGGSVILKNGIDLVARVVNKVNPNTTLTKANYQVVKVSGAQGQRLAVELAQANTDNNSADTLGIVIETIAANQEGFIMTVGQLEGINTTGSLQGETWTDGDVLYLSPTTAGRITNIKPTGATGHIVVIGYVEYAHANNGKIYVKIMNGWELDELHNVSITTPLNNQGLVYETSTDLWKNKTIDKTFVGLGNVDNTSDANKPISTATQTALNAKENTITAGTTSQYYRGDKTFQTLDKSAVGLGNVDNTSDANKPVSTAQQTAIDAKVADSITDGVTTIAPSQNAVFDALALKQNSLGYKPYRFIDTANAVNVIGTTAETTLLTITIPPNSFAANDVINIPFLSIVKIGTAGNCNIRLRVSSTNLMATATQIALYTATTTQINPTISRHYSLNGGFLKGLNATTSVVNDILANGTSQVTAAFDTTITQYLFITVTNGSIADSTSLMGVQITN